MVRATNFRTGRHVVYNIQAHLVCAAKYRRAVINERVLAVLKTAWQQVCSDFECDQFRGFARVADNRCVVVYKSCAVVAVSASNSSESSWARCLLLRHGEAARPLIEITSCIAITQVGALERSAHSCSPRARSTALPPRCQSRLEARRQSLRAPQPSRDRLAQAALLRPQVLLRLQVLWRQEVL
jgi:hypothetical protein